MTKVITGIGIGLLTMILIGGSHSAKATVAGGNLNQAHVATWNIFGGNGNALTNFNANVAPIGGSNTVQTRVKSRWPYLYGLGLQEICESQYQTIRFELYVDGYWLGGSIGGTQGFLDKLVLGLSPLIGTDSPSASCGSWFGSAVYIRGDAQGTGARFSSQIPPNSSHKARYQYICLWNTYAVCSAHLAPHSVQTYQSAELKTVANFLVGLGFRTYILGDFNVSPGLLTMSWAGDGWRDGDQYSGGLDQATTHSGNIVDYVWSNSPSPWTADAWVPHSSSSLSDHYWKQGYF